MTKPATPPPTSATSRRSWLKGFGALLGTGLLAPSTTLFAASPKADNSPTPEEAASAQVGGDEFIGMVKLLTGTTVPAGWALCDGRLLPVNQHPALFALLGFTYGGDGRSTFALPDLRAYMTDMAATVAAQKPGGVPLGQLCVVKVANAPALTTAVAELQLKHLHRHRLATV